MFEKIIFGSYGTYAFSDKKRPLVWQNEFASDRKAIVTLTELLPERAYDLDAGGNDWRDSELRAWLNKEFIEEAFTKKEQEAIYPKDLATWREYYPGDVSYSKDRITIPEAGHRYDIRPKKSLRNHLLEGAFQGCWLRNGVKVTRTAYIDEKEKTRVKDGSDPRRKLSVAPVLYLEPEKLPKKIVRDTLRTIENGVLLDDDFFYCNGEHIRYHVDRTGEFAYVLTDRKEAVIVGEFLTEIFEDRELVFPGKLDRYPVIAILGEYRLKSVKRIVVEEGIRMIGEECFVLCDVLEEVVLPDTLLDLHSSNFTACPKLAKVHISEGNPHYCIDENAIYTKDRKKLIKYISEDAYQVFTVPEGVEEIAPGAFSEVQGMKEIGLPDSMVRLGAYAFADSDVEQVYLNEGLTFIDECAFLGSRLKKIIVPDTAVYLKERIFENCKNLQKIVFPKKVDYFGEQMLKGCSILKSVRLPEGTRVLRETFTDCVLLKQIYVPKSVKEIDEKEWSPDGELTVYGMDGSEAEAYAKKMLSHF